MTQYRPTLAEIDLGAIRENVGALGEFVAPNVERLAVVKANAYGHGDVEVARACLDAGATRLGVALVEEGVRLREAGIDAPILVLIEAIADAAKQIVSSALTPSVSSSMAADVLNEAASVAGKRLPVHVCVDTGMHREGAPFEAGLRLVEHVARLESLELEGLWSHFALGEQDAHPFTGRQVELFADLCASVERKGIDVAVRHLTSSAGIVLYPESHYDMVRMGIMLYGLYPHASLASRITLRPAMRLVSAVGMTRRVPAGEGVSYGLTWAPDTDTTIATVPIGYGDGYARLLSNRASVLVDGRRRRIAGRVTMDQILVDCGDADVAAGDEVVLIGRQGDEEITADDIASEIGTINYEVVCALGPRVPRTYVQ
ncbi:MAG TPA: alanine racemase [Actinomycetota bacterium]|nr:alanine racemase [Actinomycetota bacterium]